LTARRFVLDDDRTQSFGSAVDRRGESARAAADDHHIVLVVLRRDA